MANLMTAVEISATLSQSIRTVRQWAKKEEWSYVQELDRGTLVKKYITNVLPEERKNALDKQLVANQETDLPAKQEKVQSITSLKGWQREVMNARVKLLKALEITEVQHGVNQAVKQFLVEIKGGLLPPHLMELISVANARSGGKSGNRTLSRATVFRWRKWGKMVREGRATIAIFAPKDPEKKEAPKWAEAFLSCYRVPSKPSVPHAMEKMLVLLPVGVGMPTERQVRRFVKKMSAAELEKGRSSGAELRHFKPFKRRKKDDMPPLTVGEIDGHSCKFRVQNPESGNPFKPEVCGIICVSTRYYFGVGFGLAESAHTVADAVRDAATVRDWKPYAGIFDIIHADNGSGNTAHQNTDALFGLFPRIGTTFKTGRVGNPMGQGGIERSQASVWIRAGKELASFAGKSMDSGASRKFDLALKADAKLKGTSDMVMSWSQFKNWAKKTINDYNNRPNSALPRITDATTGKRRYATPTEAVEAWIAAGWDITDHQLTPVEVEILFRPRVVRVVRNGEVQFGNKIYYHDILSNYHGKKVQLAYDLVDLNTVQIWDNHDRLLCYALINGNSIGYYPESEKERAAKRRAKRRSDIKKKDLLQIEQERRGTIDMGTKIFQQVAKQEQPAPLPSPPKLKEKEEKEVKQGWKVPANPLERYKAWKVLDNLKTSGIALEDKEIKFYEAYRKTPAYKALAVEGA